MPLADAGSTHPSLLRSAADRQDQVAWSRIHRQYDGHLRRCCASMRLDTHDADEVCQNTWLQIATLIEFFAYDPSKSFRGWLWNVCRIQVLKYLDSKKMDPSFSLEERDEWSASRRGLCSRGENLAECSDFAGDVDLDPSLAILYREAEQIQARVRRLVAPHTWEAFWLVSVSFWTSKEAARYLGISQALVHKANQRVLRRLRDEGRNHPGELTTVE